MVYDGMGSEQLVKDEKTWRLLKDAVRSIDVSIEGLRRLFLILQHAAPSRENSLIGPHAFKMALMSNGLKDVILIQRLFDGFRETSAPERRIDFRQFVRALATMSREPIEARVDMLFDVWDADDSGTLVYQELATHAVHDEPVHKMDSALQAFTSIWSQIKNFGHAQRQREADLEDEFANTRELDAGEVSRETLVGAVERLPGVRLFFEQMLTRRPPKADERARQMVTKNFLARLRELDGQVKEEVRAGVRGDAPGSRPSTVSKAERDAKAIKEKTDAIFKQVSMTHSQSFSTLNSSSTQAVARARELANSRSQNFSRPKTVGSPGSRNNIHAFVRGGSNASAGSFEKLPRRLNTAISMP